MRGKRVSLRFELLKGLRPQDFFHCAAFGRSSELRACLKCRRPLSPAHFLLARSAHRALLPPHNLVVQNIIYSLLLSMLLEGRGWKEIRSFSPIRACQQPFQNPLIFSLEFLELRGKFPVMKVQKCSLY